MFPPNDDLGTTIERADLANLNGAVESKGAERVPYLRRLLGVGVGRQAANLDSRTNNMTKAW